MRGSWKLKDGTPAKSYIAEGEVTTPDGIKEKGGLVEEAIKDSVDNLYGEPTIEN